MSLGFWVRRDRYKFDLSNSDVNLSVLEEMARRALIEDREGKTEKKGFGEEINGNKD